MPMKRLLALLAAFFLIAATPGDVVSSLQANGYYIEPGTDVSEQVVSDGVSDGRSDGGRLYMVVLAEEPPGGATTFSDSTLDLLGGDGYVVTVAPQTVGFAGDGTFWTSEQMNEAIDASLDGASDDEVVQLFVADLTGEATPGGTPGSGSSSGGGIPWGWIILLGGGGFLAWWYFSNRRRSSRQVANRMTEVKSVAKEKLAEVANDILDMEDEVATAQDPEVHAHYQRASALYSEAMEDTERATTVSAMLEVSNELDLAIWELDCAEALLDGKPRPPQPQPPQPEPVVPPQPTTSAPPVPPAPPRGSDYDRRPQRQSTGSNEMMTMLMTMMAMGSMRGRGGGFGGGFGGFGGGGRGGGPPMGGGGGRIRGGGRRRG